MGRAYEADEPGYAKGDRVWLPRGRGSREPGVVIGYYVDWGLYRVIYVVDLAGPRAVVGWRLILLPEAEVLTSPARVRAD